MRKLKTILIVLMSLTFLSLGTAWAKNTTTSQFLAAASQLKMTTKPSTVKPVKQLVIKKPDLSIQKMKWSYPLKQGYVVGQNSILNFTIKNQGTASSGNFIIKFTCPNCPASMTGTRKMTSMAPGAAMGHNWPSPSSVPEKWAAGTYKLEALVDPGRVIQDTKRANNRKIINFVVQGVPISKKKIKPINQKSLTQITVGKRITSGFDFTTQPEPGTTGKRIVQGFNFSTIPEDGTTGIRTVSGFDFSTQPTPGTTGIRTVQGFNFIKQ